jgi:hypothetical protein
MIQLPCPGCNSVLQAADALAGRRATCPRCGTDVVLELGNKANAGAEPALAAIPVPPCAPPALPEPVPAEIAELGSWVAECRGPHKVPDLVLYVGLILTIAGVIGMGAAGHLGLDGLVGVLVLVVGAFLCWAWWMTRDVAQGRRVVVFEKGVVYFQPGSWRVYRWANIQYVDEVVTQLSTERLVGGMKDQQFTSYRIVPYQGEEATFDPGFQHLEWLGSYIRLKVRHCSESR